MTTIEQPLSQLISLSEIRPDPANPRAKLRDIDDLAASIALHGVLEPITVRRSDADDCWFIVRGHRRHAAAKQALVEMMQCIVEYGGDELSRATERMVENLQRDDLNAVEHARGIQQLLDLGLSDEQAARSLSVPVESVQGARTIAGSKATLEAAEKHDLSFDRALGIAEFDGNAEVVKGDFDYVAFTSFDEAHQASRIARVVPPATVNPFAPHDFVCWLPAHWLTPGRAGHRSDVHEFDCQFQFHRSPPVWEGTSK